MAAAFFCGQNAASNARLSVPRAPRLHNAPRGPAQEAAGDVRHLAATCRDRFGFGRAYAPTGAR